MLDVGQSASSINVGAPKVSPVVNALYRGLQTPSTGHSLDSVRKMLRRAAINRHCLT